MVPVVTIADVRRLIARIGLERFFMELIACLQEDFAAWSAFSKVPRLATYLEHGVLELMPICGPDFYSFKFVNGHPQNPLQSKQTVVALGLLADVRTGYPLMVSEMTLLTALRTAATSALAARYLARTNSQCMAIIGTGAQSEFQVLALHYALNINTVKYYDQDHRAMHKFANNLRPYSLELIAGVDVESTIDAADAIITATAARQRANILRDEWIRPGIHINAIGGDAPGKTELDPAILLRSKIVVEYWPQTQHEGEVQHHIMPSVYAELWQLAVHEKVGREKQDEITLFDSVGFALEDYSILRYVYQLIQQDSEIQCLPLLPTLNNPKNLFGVLNHPSAV